MNEETVSDLRMYVTYTQYGPAYTGSSQKPSCKKKKKIKSSSMHSSPLHKMKVKVI